MFDKFKSIFSGQKPGPHAARNQPATASTGHPHHHTGDLDPSQPPEILCDLRDGMTEEELQQQLAALYKRHNRAASSLDPKRRREAEIMLDAVVECRKKYLTSHS